MKLSRSLLDAALLLPLGAILPTGAVAAAPSLRAATDAAAAEAIRADRAAQRAQYYRSFAGNENEHCFLPECELRTGTYLDPYGEELEWWAFVPVAPDACPDGGCPLFVAIDGTGDEFFDPPDQQTWMIEMLRRGFAGVTMAYANSFEDLGFCYGQPLDFIGGTPGIAEFGVVQKAQHIFDPSIEGSIIQQACDGPDAFANCELGIAAAGVSQGSLMAAQGSNFDKRISALLLWATGDIVQVIRDFIPGVDPTSTGAHVSDWDLPCMDSVQLPAVRRRMINGDRDRYFGRNAAGTLTQYKTMTGGYYDCGVERDCLTRTPATVADAYTGSSIANEGGYFIVEGDHVTEWIRCQCNGAACSSEEEHACNDPAPYFSGDGIEQGPASFDWLARTAKAAYDAPAASVEEVTLEVDLGHWRLLHSSALHGFFFEWADVNGAFGQRQKIGESALLVTHTLMKPDGTPGFRLSSATSDAAFVDRLEVFTSVMISRWWWTEEVRTTVGGMKFGVNRGDGWCLSPSPEDTFYDLCVDGQAYSCWDFCANGDVHPCDGNDISSCYNFDGNELDRGNVGETVAAVVE